MKAATKRLKQYFAFLTSHFLLTPQVGMKPEPPQTWEIEVGDHVTLERLHPVISNSFCFFQGTVWQKLWQHDLMLNERVAKRMKLADLRKLDVKAIKDKEKVCRK